MISNKLRLILSGIAIILFFYVFMSNSKNLFNSVNIGLFIMFITYFIISLVRQIKDKK